MQKSRGRSGHMILGGGGKTAFFWRKRLAKPSCHLSGKTVASEKICTINKNIKFPFLFLLIYQWVILHTYPRVIQCYSNDTILWIKHINCLTLAIPKPHFQTIIQRGWLKSCICLLNLRDLHRCAEIIYKEWPQNKIQHLC